MTKASALLWVLLAAAGAVRGQSAEEIIVTASRSESVRVPATSLTRRADYLLIKVEVTNDSRDYKTRRSEIYTTLRALLAAAERDRTIELSVVRDEIIVLPLKLDDATLNFEDTGAGGTLETTVIVKTPVDKTADGAALLAKLKKFVESIDAEGRTTLMEDDDAQVSMVNIAQYRDPVIQLFAADVKKITTALGGDYRVVIRGLDQPIQWVRSSTLEVTIFVPYQYDVVPTTVSSYSPSSRVDED